MVQFIQNFFLSPFLMFIILFVVFILLSWWALNRRQEYIGYGLGWLIGVFFMVIYGAMAGEPEPVPQSEIPVTMNLLQVLIPSISGIPAGIWAMSLLRQDKEKTVYKTLAITFLTALSLTILFLLIVSAPYPVTQRMIGIFAMAFAIGAVTMLAIQRQTTTDVPQGHVPKVQDDNQRQNIPNAPIEIEDGKSFRERIGRR